MDLGLRSKTALITGGAGGIGRATADLLTQEGVRVGAADLQPPDGVGEVAVALDVTDEASVTDAVASAERALGRIDVLVNCAGIYRIGEIDAVPPADWDQMLDINLRGTYLVCRAVLPGMRRRGAGCIVNLSSISGRTRSILASPAYVASKAGVIGLTMTLAAQNAKHGIRVNAVAPGPVDTEMIRALPADLQPTVVAAIPMGRLGTAQEIAHCIAFLTSEGAGFITGETLNVNGGAFMV
jgi:3-oxoacyl-[acyl-carrier protein] reductase